MSKSTKIEQHTEQLVRDEMHMKLGDNEFGIVYAQGENTPISAINEALKRAGGKPKECALSEYIDKAKGYAKPEYIITLKKDLTTIIVVECKNKVGKHMSNELNKPASFAVDGVLYYAKYLKDDFNVIALAVSGTSKDKMKVSVYDWRRGQAEPIKIDRAENIILEPENYLKLVRGEKVQKSFSLEDIKSTAIKIHEEFYKSAVGVNQKALFIAGMLIALQDDIFCNDYDKLSSFDTLLSSASIAIERVLSDGEISIAKSKEISDTFSKIRDTKIKDIALNEDGSLRWYLKELEFKIKPMMHYVGKTVDALGIFYHEFISYSGGDSKGLGIVLTPQHITEFMTDLINIDKNSKVVDICCGSGSFLVSAMGKMFSEAITDEEVEYIRKNNLYGIELNGDIHTLALVNMILRGDGKSNILLGDCFDEDVWKNVAFKRENKVWKQKTDTYGRTIMINKALLNPPYSQAKNGGKCELEFVEHALDNLLCVGGELAVICPTSCAIGTKYKEVRERLMKKHTLKAVFSMPTDLFVENNASVDVCIMVWEAKRPHDSSIATFFGYYKNDGFVKRKKKGRVDGGSWNTIKNNWLSLYRNKQVKDGLTAMECVTDTDEWLCEAYMKTDYSKLTEADFQQTVNNYLAYLVKSGQVYMEDK